MNNEYRSALSDDSRKHLDALEERYGKDVLTMRWYYNNDIEKVSYPVEMHDVSGNPDLIHATGGGDEFYEQFTQFSPDPKYKTPFLMELTGECGKKHKKWAESLLAGVVRSFEEGYIILDENGAAFWKESGTFIHPDVCEVLLCGGCCDFSVDNCKATEFARNKQLGHK